MESISEENGLKALGLEDLNIYSVGISTAGVAEIRMIKAFPQRSIIASTIDIRGAEFAKKQIAQEGLSHKIEVKIEDVAEPLPYPDQHFDFIYARLVLHYLPKDKLDATLKELRRVLKKKGKLFVVVRSIECDEVKESSFDDATSMSTYLSKGQSYSRYFHSQESIKKHLLKAGFTLQSIKAYPEQLCVDFERKIPAAQKDHLIEVIAIA